MGIDNYSDGRTSQYGALHLAQNPRQNCCKFLVPYGMRSTPSMRQGDTHPDKLIYSPGSGAEDQEQMVRVYARQTVMTSGKLPEECIFIIRSS
jgi:hypothetical protein